MGEVICKRCKKKGVMTIEDLCGDCFEFRDDYLPRGNI